MQSSEKLANDTDQPKKDASYAINGIKSTANILEKLVAKDS